MKRYTVEIREVHISHREVEVPDNATHEEIIAAAAECDEEYLEFSHTLDSEHTIKDISSSNNQKSC